MFLGAYIRHHLRFLVVRRALRLPIICDYLRSPSAHFNLGADFLQTHSHRFDLLFLFGQFRFELLLLLVHLRLQREDFLCSFRNSLSNIAFTRVIANRVNLAILVTDDQVRIYLCDLLGNQTEFRPVLVIAFVMKRNRLKRQDRTF
jgi:hypothetical protein